MNYSLMHKDSNGNAAPCAALWGESPRLMAIIKKCLLVFFVLSVAAFEKASAQKVSISLKNASFIDALEEISKQTQYDFSYNDLILKKAKPVTIVLKNETLSNALSQLFKDQPFNYEVKERIIIVFEKSSTRPIINAMDATPVEGRVTNESGVPISDATIKVRGSNYTTKTDKNGKFIIPAEFANSVLHIHHLGYAPIETGAQRARTAVLSMVSSQIDEVEVMVNTGYQTVDKRHLTSAVTTLKMDDIKTAGINTVDKLLEGRVPGMIFMQNSGQVGAAPRLRIRGTSTVLGTREPLWVLDGIVLTDPVNVDPQQINDLDFVNLLGNAIGGLNPEDIEQIDVLKDASATALYGARAGNGVIVITTKKGKIGKPTISYAGASSFSTRPRYSDRSIYMMNSQERMEVSKEMVDRKIRYNNITEWAGYEKALQDYYAGLIDYNEFKRLSDYYGTVNTDWLKLLMRDSYSQNHSVNLSGGASEIRYYASLGYNNENGVIQKESNKRYSSVLNVTADYKKFTAQVSFSGNYSVKNYTPSEVGIMNYAYNMSRTMPAYHSNGDLFYYPRFNSPLFYDYNILKERDNAGDHSNTLAANIKALIKFKIMSGLDVESTFAYGISNNNQETYYTKDSFYNFKLRRDHSERNDLSPIGGELKKIDTRNNNYTARLQTNYLKSFGADKKHLITASAGLEVRSTEYNGFNMTRRGYFPEMGGYFEYIPTKYTGYYQQWMSEKAALGYYDRQLSNEVAWYGTSGYSWDDRYIMNVHIRGEQSNLFGRRSNNSFMPIWAISGRWNMHKDIVKNVHWVNDLALKGSWGWQGNMLPGQSADMVMRQAMNMNVYYNSTFATIANFPNPDLRWERTSSSNVALEFSLFNSKLRGSVGYFYKRTKDAYLDKTVSEINGVEKYVINSGTLENKGVEVSLSITAIDKTGLDSERRGFVWRFDPQLGQVLNKVLNRAINNRNNVLQDNVSYNDFLTGSIQLAGKPINTFYSYKFKGLSNVDGSPIFYGAEPELADEYRAKYSQMELEDVYLQVLEESGRREPFIQGGISNYFGWRNFGLSFNVTYSLGNKIRMLKIASGYGSTVASPQQNLRKEFVYRWRQPGDEAYTNIPGIQTSNNNNMPWWNTYPASAYTFGGSVYDMYDNSDVRLVSADHLKLQSASLRYNVQENITKRLGLGSAYISITGTNLFMWTNKQLKGQDPAQSGSSPNINLSLRPVYSGSINLSF